MGLYYTEAHVGIKLRIWGELHRGVARASPHAGNRLGAEDAARWQRGAIGYSPAMQRAAPASCHAARESISCAQSIRPELHHYAMGVPQKSNLVRRRLLPPAADKRARHPRTFNAYLYWLGRKSHARRAFRRTAPDNCISSSIYRRVIYALVPWSPKTNPGRWRYAGALLGVKESTAKRLDQAGRPLPARYRPILAAALRARAAELLALAAELTAEK